MPQKPLTGSDDETAAIMAKKKADAAKAAETSTDDSPAPGVPAASPRDASKAAWDFGHDFDGASHRGGAELEAIKEELITDLRASWPYNLDFGPEQNAAKVPAHLAALGFRDFELYAYLVLTGFELSPAEREKAYGEVNLVRFVKRPEIAGALAAIRASVPTVDLRGVAAAENAAVTKAIDVIGAAYAAIKAGASSAAMAPAKDAALWQDYYSRGTMANCFVENLRQREAKKGTPGAGAGGFSETSSPGGSGGGLKG